MPALAEYHIFTATLTNGSILRKGIATDSEDLEEHGAQHFFPPGATITPGPTIHIEDFPGLDDIVTFE